MPLLIEDCRTPLRIALGDDPSAMVTSYTNEQLDSIIKSSIMMGIAPECLELNDDKTAIDPPPVNKDTFGMLILSAAQFVLNTDTPVNIKTRAMNVSVNPNARRDTLHAIELMIYKLEQKGNICGDGTGEAAMMSQDCMTYFDTEFYCNGKANCA